VDDLTGRLSDVVEFSYPAALREEPSAVVFNGHDGAATRDAPLRARAGETVRIFFGNAGPNLTSSFHVIGSCFDRVFRDGDVLSPPGRCVSTVSVPPGAATVVDMEMSVPGTYALVDHAIFRMDKGAVGFLNVSGPPRPDVYQSVLAPEPCVGCKLHA
jgi:FtsP/CotA-like multicopper oxidase with cupredoxin domain